MRNAKGELSSLHQPSSSSGRQNILNMLGQSDKEDGMMPLKLEFDEYV